MSFAIGATTAHAEDKTITVFAAASLKNALDDVDRAFTKQSGIKVVVSYGASSALAKQIEQCSADLQWMDYGVQKKVIKDDTRVNLLGNKLGCQDWTMSQSDRASILRNSPEMTE